MVTRHIIADAIQTAGIAGSVVCGHASLRSFGHVDGGADAVVRAFLDGGCTLIVPTFTYTSAPPPVGRRLRQNAYDYDKPYIDNGRRYSALENDIDLPSMGRIPEAVLNTAGRVRGDHPIDSFAAVGPLAAEVIGGQQPLDVYAPLRQICDRNGHVVLMGVGLNKLTLLHLAEHMAGRNLFRRWGAYADGRCVEAEAGSCSDGFPALEPVLEPLTNRILVGESTWRILPAATTVQLASDAIACNPTITHCSNPDCERCRDAILGGPLLS